MANLLADFTGYAVDAQVGFELELWARGVDSSPRLIRSEVQVRGLRIKNDNPEQW